MVNQTNQLDYSAVSRLGLRLRSAQAVAPQRMDAWLDQVGDRLVEVMRDKAPDRSGELRNHIVKISEPGKVRVGIYGVPYARYVIEGTRPHVIRPRQASALAFRIGGKLVVVKVVHHPGTRPNTFMKDSVKQVLRESRGWLTGLKFRIGPNGQ